MEGLLIMKDSGERRQKTGFIDLMQVTGNYIADFFLVQLLFILNTVRGGVVLGLFPAVSSTYNYLFSVFLRNDKKQSITKEFNRSWKKYFKKSNQVGYSLLAIYLFLYMDLRLNENIVQSPTLHTLLLIVLALVAFTTVYTFTVLVGHSLSYKEIFKQSFFVSLASPVFTIAALIGFLVVYELLKQFNFIALFFGFPLLVLPLAWFTFSGLEKIEEMKEDMTDDIKEDTKEDMIEQND